MNFPIPEGPRKRYAEASLPPSIACASSSFARSCPGVALKKIYGYEPLNRIDLLFAVADLKMQFRALEPAVGCGIAYRFPRCDARSHVDSYPAEIAIDREITALVFDNNDPAVGAQPEHLGHPSLGDRINPLLWFGSNIDARIAEFGPESALFHNSERMNDRIGNGRPGEAPVKFFKIAFSFRFWHPGGDFPERTLHLGDSERILLLVASYPIEYRPFRIDCGLHTVPLGAPEIAVRGHTEHNRLGRIYHGLNDLRLFCNTGGKLPAFAREEGKIPQPRYEIAKPFSTEEKNQFASPAAYIHRAKNFRLNNSCGVEPDQGIIERVGQAFQAPGQERIALPEAVQQVAHECYLTGKAVQNPDCIALFLRKARDITPLTRYLRSQRIVAGGKNRTHKKEKNCCHPKNDHSYF